jgi:Holliday junction resolvase-like predicted endonuclease
MAEEISMAELKEMIRDLTRSQQENGRELEVLKTLFQETDRMLSSKFSDTDKKLNKATELFTSQWGRLIESLVEGDLAKILQQRGIAVTDTTSRRKGKKRGENFEFDIIAHNGDEIVIVEVKTTLRPDDVKDFKAKMGKAKLLLTEYQHYQIYGAMAYLQADAGAEIMAEKQGFFVIKATGNSASIINDVQFVPKIF